MKTYIRSGLLAAGLLGAPFLSGCGSESAASTTETVASYRIGVCDESTMVQVSEAQDERVVIDGSGNGFSLHLRAAGVVIRQFSAAGEADTTSFVTPDEDAETFRQADSLTNVSVISIDSEAVALVALTTCSTYPAG
jgi:hypothetical protein